MQSQHLTATSRVRCKAKQQAATEPEEDYGEELEDYDGEEDGPPWDEDEEENEETEDGE